MDRDIRKAFGETIRELRQDRKLSQEAFADLCGLHRTYISDIELGKRNVSLDNITLISNTLDMSITDLFKFVEEKYERI